MKESKQVIILRKDLKMSEGKAATQAAHASVAAIMTQFDRYLFLTVDECPVDVLGMIESKQECPVKDWLYGKSFKKIVLAVESEKELLELEEKAKYWRFPYALIEDNGLTEFNGVKTKTALAIGPWWGHHLDNITGKLSLY